MQNFSLPESSKKNFYELYISKGVINYMNNVSFQGHTNLVLDPDVYDKACRITRGVYRHLSYNTNSKLANGKIYTSKADAQNIAVILRNEKDGIIKHVPVNGKTQSIIDEIARKAEELKATAKGKLTAWIIGGTPITKSPESTKTIETVNKIADVICDKPDIDASILAGSLTGEDRIVIHTKNNFLEIILDKVLKLNTKKQKPDITDLEKYFDIVQINNTDLSI